MNKQINNFSFSPPINLVEGGKCFLVVISFDCTNSVFKITKNNTFSITTPSYWTPENSEELVNELNKLLELGSENDIELHVVEIEKRSTQIEIENRGYN